MGGGGGARAGEQQHDSRGQVGGWSRYDQNPQQKQSTTNGVIPAVTQGEPARSWNVQHALLHTTGMQHLKYNFPNAQVFTRATDSCCPLRASISLHAASSACTCCATGIADSAEVCRGGGYVSLRVLLPQVGYILQLVQLCRHSVRSGWQALPRLGCIHHLCAQQQSLHANDRQQRQLAVACMHAGLNVHCSTAEPNMSSVQTNAKCRWPLRVSKHCAASTAVGFCFGVLWADAACWYIPQS